MGPNVEDVDVVGSWAPAVMTGDTRPTGKLRQSCDACANSKVRCGKERPTCHRCQIHHMQCHYSTKRRIAKSRGSTSTSNSASKTTTHVEERNAPPSRESGAMSAHSGMISLDPSNYPSPDLNNAAFDDYNITSSRGSGMSSSLSDLYSSDSHLTTPYRTSSQDFTQFDLCMSAASTALPSVFDTNCIFSKSEQLSSFRKLDQNVTDQSPCIQPENYSSQAPSDDLTSQYHDCNGLTIPILLRLQMPLTSCTSIASAEAPVPRSIDWVLESNAKAMNEILTILNCPCSLNPNLAFAISHISCKILAWYQTIASDWMCANNASSRDTLLTAESAAFLPMMIGTYQPSREERDKMIRQLVLSGLTKMGWLIEKFAKRYCQGGDGEWAGKTDICLALEIYLTTRLKLAMEGLAVETWNQ